MAIDKVWGNGNQVKETTMFIMENIKTIKNLEKANTLGIMGVFLTAISSTI